MRRFLLKLLGALLFVYGLVALAGSWYAYSITREAFSSIRSFTNLLDRERSAAADTLRQASGLVSGGAGPASGTPTGSGFQGLRDRFSGLFGGRPGPAGSSTPALGSGGAGSEGLRLLDDLESRLKQASASWSKLGDGPIRVGLLDQVETVTNAVLAWMAVHGVVSLVIGAVLIFGRSGPVSSSAPTAPQATSNDAPSTLARPGRISEAPTLPGLRLPQQSIDGPDEAPSRQR